MENTTDYLNRKKALEEEQKALSERKREIAKELAKIEDKLLAEAERLSTKVGKYYKNLWTGELMKITSYEEGGKYAYWSLLVSSFENGDWEVSYGESKIDNWNLSRPTDYQPISEEEFMSALQRAMDTITPFEKTLRAFNCLGAKE